MIRKKLCAIFQRTGPLQSGTSIRFCRSAPRIHFRNNFFVPLTSTGEHPKPISCLIAPRRWISSLNQSAHAGTTGNPNRWAIRYSTKVGSLSHRIVRLWSSPSHRVDSITLYLRFMDSCQLWCHTLLTCPDNSQCIGVTFDCAGGRFPVLRVWVQSFTSSQQTLSPDDSPGLLRS